MPTPTLTVADLDQAAARTAPTVALTVAEREAWAGIAATCTRELVTRSVDELVDEALRNVPLHGTRPAADVRLPGRISRALPDWAHRTVVDLSHKPSTQLAVSAEILRRWGWQNRPHHLRNLRGQRCVCGAICTAVALGVGTEDSAGRAAGYVLTELRHRGWAAPALIGDWNQNVCQTADQAIDLVTAAQHRAAAAGN